MKLFSGKVDFVTGLNYFQEDSESGGTNYQRRGTSTYSATGGAANGNTNRDLVITRGQDVDQKANSYGWFNSATWHITDKLNLTGGGRFAWDKKDLAISKSKGNASDTFKPVPGTTSTDVAADHNWDAFDWRGTLDYHFTPDIMGYATGSKAYKAGAYTYTVTSCTGAVGSATCLTGAQQSAQIQPIPPENVINMEAGVRATLFDGRLRINPTGYYMAWTDRQTAVRVSCAVSPECPQGSNVILRNTGNIDLYGMELDAQFALTDNLILDGAYGTTVSIIHDVAANGGPNLFPPQASPTFYVGATYNLRETRFGRFTFNANYSYTAEQETYPESSDPAANSDVSLPAAQLLHCQRAGPVDVVGRRQLGLAVRQQSARQGLRQLRHQVRRRILGYFQSRPTLGAVAARCRCAAAQHGKRVALTAAGDRAHVPAQLCRTLRAVTSARSPLARGRVGIVHS